VCNASHTSRASSTNASAARVRWRSRCHAIAITLAALDEIHQAPVVLGLHQPHPDLRPRAVPTLW